MLVHVFSGDIARQRRLVSYQSRSRSPNPPVKILELGGKSRRTNSTTGSAGQSVGNKLDSVTSRQTQLLTLRPPSKATTNNQWLMTPSRGPKSAALSPTLTTRDNSVFDPTQQHFALSGVIGTAKTIKILEQLEQRQQDDQTNNPIICETEYDDPGQQTQGIIMCPSRLHAIRFKQNLGGLPVCDLLKNLS